MTELAIVLTITGVLMAIAAPRVQLALDRVAVHTAASDILTVLGSARALALAGRASVGVDIDSATGTLRISRRGQLVSVREIGTIHGVRLQRTRDSLTYDARGLGHGAANLSILVRRGAAAETVFVSRLGRVR